MTPGEFRRLGHALVDWIAEYRSGIDSRPVLSPARPGQIRAGFPAEPPEHGTSLDGILEEVERLVLPGITHWNHPRFFAYFPSNSSLASVAAELLSAGLGVQGMSWETSPAATELEQVVLDWLRRMLGLPAEFSGVIQDTASTATLVALLCARERATEFSQGRGGLAAEASPLAVYASDQSHSSVGKAALLAGFGRDNLRVVATDEAHAMRSDDLRRAVARDRGSGRRPCAVVATIGTTATTAIDPLGEIAAIAREEGLWLHVDAAMAGSAMILPECRPLWTGVALCDSVVLNPHKWMGVGFDFSAYYVRDVEHLVRVMSTNPSYLRTPHDAKVANFRDWGIPLGRRFRALKLWFVLRDQGVEGLRARLRRDLENARWLRDQVDAAPGWERLAPVPLQTVCVRHAPPELSGEEALSAHNLAIAGRINGGGRGYVTPAVLKGRQMIRISIGAEATERRHVEDLWRDFQAAARDVAAPDHSPR
jgi:aromatic-L-amino-acid decarboxylase